MNRTLIAACIMFTMFGTESQAAEEHKIKLNEPAMMQEWPCEDAGSPYSPWRFTEEEKDLIAHMMEAEAGGEGDIGLTLIADVILNRVASPDFPNTITEVLYQPGQFQPVEDGRLWEVEPSELCYEIISDIETEYYGISDALYFCELNSDRWHETKEYLFTYRNHKFYR